MKGKSDKARPAINAIAVAFAAMLPLAVSATQVAYVPQSGDGPWEWNEVGNWYNNVQAAAQQTCRSTARSWRHPNSMSLLHFGTSVGSRLWRTHRTGFRSSSGKGLNYGVM